MASKMEYVTITPSKFEEVILHLREHFPDEPLNQSVGLCTKGEPCELLEHHDLITMQDGLSLMALDAATGEIAGVALNGIARRGDVEEALDDMKSIESVEFHRIFGLLNNTNKELDLFSKYNVDQIFETRILSVNPKYRGQGIAKELLLRSISIAEANGFKVAKADATSFFTQKMAADLGFIVEKAVKYSEFKDENGKKIYDTKSPHDYYKVVTKMIGNN